MDKYIIIGLIILMILLLIIHSTGSKTNYTEKFQDTQMPNIEACPADLNRYTTDRGINCCEGPIENGQCKGTPRCTLSNNVPGLIRCVDYKTKNNDEQTKKYCPKGTFFYDGIAERGNLANIIGYCTKSKLSADLSRRIAPLDDMCVEYKDRSTNEKTINSCWVRKKIQSIPLPTKDAKVQVKKVKNFPLIFYVNYIDEMEGKICFDRETMNGYFDKYYSSWRSNRLFKKFIYNKMKFCDVVREKLAARSRDPNYKSPMAQAGLNKPLF
jgi:hypothetical protein